MKTNKYECPECGYLIGVGDYSRLITGQSTCWDEQCDASPREYNLITPGGPSIFAQRIKEAIGDKPWEDHKPTFEGLTK